VLYWLAGALYVYQTATLVRVARQRRSGPTGASLGAA
jgi:hypothetical protein